MKYNFTTIPARENTDSVKYDLRGEVFGNENILPMWVADMDFESPPPVVEALEKRLSHPLYGYSFRPPEYFESIISWTERLHNWKIEKEWICFSPGIVPALNFCTLALTSPGDSIVVQPPVYFPFFTAVTDHGRILVQNQLSEKDKRYTFDLHSLKEQIDSNTRLLFLCNPHNPVGRAWTREELLELGNICLERGVIIISDEIHSDLVLPGYRHTPMAKVSEEIANITITCMGPSKTFNLAGFFTSSVIISNEELRQKFRKLTSSLHIESGNIFGTVASIAAYSKGWEWRLEMLDYIKGNIDFTIDYINSRLSPLKAVVTEATYLVWIDCRGLGINDTELRDFFINKAGVGLNEGIMFGAGGEGFMRLNVACPQKTLVKALERIRKVLKQ